MVESGSGAQKSSQQPQASQDQAQQASNAQGAQGAAQMTDEEVAAAQKAIDERIAQDHANAAYEAEIRREINESMPHVTDLLDLAVLKEEYKANKFENCFDILHAKYTKVRRMRRDGSCFYRSFLFQVFEHCINNPNDRSLLEKLKRITDASKEDLMTNAGYDEVVIDDFYEAFKEAVHGLEKVKPGDCVTHLMGLLANDENANYLIMYIRWLTACFLKKNAILYEDFVGGDIAGFCVREVEQLDVDADHLQIISLTSYFEMGVEINSVDGHGTIQTILLPEDGYNGWRPKLLYVPGHYDALYA